MIQLRMLGQVDLRAADGRELRDVLVQPKRFALLAHLAVAHGEFRRRDTLLGLFWPDLDQPHARDALKQAVSHLRRTLPSDEIVVVGRGTEELAVDTHALWSDVGAFRDASAAGQTEQALELYRGDLLDGFYANGAPEFDDWLSRERHRLRASAAKHFHAFLELWKNADPEIQATVDDARQRLAKVEARDRALAIGTGASGRSMR